MKPRFPLFAKILLWFFLNLALLAGVFLLFCGAQLRLGLDSLLAGGAGERVRAVSEVIASDLRQRPPGEWSEALRRLGAAYGVQFALYQHGGAQVAGAELELPGEVAGKLQERRGGGQGAGHGPPPGRGPRRFQEGGPAGAELRFQLRTSGPRRYWVGVCLPLFEPGEPWPLTLLLVSPSLQAGGLLFDFTPWIAAGLGAVLLSVVFWFPLVRGLTRAISQLQAATEEIAEGRFEVRLRGRRADELGRLGEAVNRLAERLGGFVLGQKRFLGDIAHELGSPVARLEMALGVLEDKVGQAAPGEVADAREEVEHMSRLVHELLTFSRAGWRQAVVLREVPLAGLVREVVGREAPAGAVEERIDPSLCVQADPDLLGRALANLVRNAGCYAGASGGVTVGAERREDGVVAIAVADEGPGVPTELLQRVFDPFFRAEPSRSRDLGGAGLGLAIVKTCVEACGGRVSARNRDPRGFEVEMVLRAAGGLPRGEGSSAQEESGVAIPAAP